MVQPLQTSPASSPLLFGAVRFAKPGELPNQGEKEIRLNQNLDFCLPRRIFCLIREFGKNSILIINDQPVNGKPSQDLTHYLIIRAHVKRRQRLERIKRHKSHPRRDYWYKAVLAMNKFETHNAKLLRKARMKQLNDAMKSAKKWIDL